MTDRLIYRRCGPYRLKYWLVRYEQVKGRRYASGQAMSAGPLDPPWRSSPQPTYWKFGGSTRGISNDG